MTDAPDDDDLIAAEFVLGTLEPEQRAAAAERSLGDGAFAASIAAWEHRLAPMSEATRPVDPPSHVWAAILARLGFTSGQAPSERDFGRTVVVLNRSVRRWKRATALVTALAACLAIVVVADLWRSGVGPAPTFVALLQPAGASPAYVMRADLRDRTVAVHTLNATAPPGRSFELWIIDPQIGPPRSLGVLDPATSTHPLPAGTSPDVLARATYAVTEEQAGGSPSGAPTSAPVYVGHLVSSAF